MVTLLCSSLDAHGHSRWRPCFRLDRSGQSGGAWRRALIQPNLENRLGAHDMANPLPKESGIVREEGPMDLAASVNRDAAFDLVHADMLRLFPDLVTNLGGDPEVLLKRVDIDP